MSEKDRRKTIKPAAKKARVVRSTHVENQVPLALQEPPEPPEPPELRGTIAMLETILRIHHLLRRGYPVSTSRIMNELEVKGRRTVLRYIEYMRRMGADIEYDQEKRGYRYVGEPIDLPAATLTADDVLALYIASPILAQYRGTELGVQFEKSFQKITAGLSEPLRARIADLSQKVEARGRAPKGDYAERFSYVLNAVERDRQLSIVYFSAHRGATEPRTIDPYVLCAANAKWYVIAHDYKRNRVLKFAIDRIWQVNETGKSFKRPAGFNAGTLLSDTFGIYQSPEDESSPPSEICIWFDAFAARYVQETKWHASQTVAPGKDGGIELTWVVRGTVEVERFVLAWGEHAQILRPTALRAHVRSRLARTLAHYAEAHGEPS